MFQKYSIQCALRTAELEQPKYRTTGYEQSASLMLAHTFHLLANREEIAFFTYVDFKYFQLIECFLLQSLTDSITWWVKTLYLNQATTTHITASNFPATYCSLHKSGSSHSSGNYTDIATTTATATAIANATATARATGTDTAVDTDTDTTTDAIVQFFCNDRESICISSYCRHKIGKIII